MELGQRIQRHKVAHLPAEERAVEAQVARGEVQPADDAARVSVGRGVQGAPPRLAQLVGGRQIDHQAQPLQLARLLRTDANCLILDEPTNDLDVTTLGVLEDLLLDGDEKQRVLAFTQVEVVAPTTDGPQPESPDGRRDGTPIIEWTFKATRCALDGGHHMNAWFDAIHDGGPRGGDIRKQISVICLKRDGAEARRFNLFECIPSRYTPPQVRAAGANEENEEACETIELTVGYVELGP